LKELSWKHVIVVVAFLGAVVALQLAHADTSTVVVIGLAILGGVGLVATQNARQSETTQQVKEQTNGTQTRMLEMLHAMAQQLAGMQPSQPPTIDGEATRDDHVS
jgi:arginine exporter protein ArgO